MAKQWVQWDSETNRMLGMVRQLPAALEGRDAAQLAQHGYRELVVQTPENHIPRFSSLLGESKFELMTDGRVMQRFPNADFSVGRVRSALLQAAKNAAQQELAMTDWYVLRSVEQDKPIPAAVQELRKKIRDHVAWLEQDIADRSARELVDYRWMFPKSAEQVMVKGIPVVFEAREPEPLPDTITPPDPPPAATGVNIGIIGNSDPGVVDPAPPAPPEQVVRTPPVTTDGPIPNFLEGELQTHLTAEGTPLVTVYAPNVEDTGPAPTTPE